MKLTNTYQDTVTLNYTSEEDDVLELVTHLPKSRRTDSYALPNKNCPAIPKYVDLLIEVAPYGKPIIASTDETTSTIHTSVVFEYDDELYKQYLSLVKQSNLIDVAHCLPSSENGVKILDNKSSVVSTRLDLLIPAFSDEEDSVAVILTNRVNINDVLLGAEDSFCVIKTMIFVVPIEELHSSSPQLNSAQNFLQSKGYSLESINTVHHNNADYVETIFVKNN